MTCNSKTYCPYPFVGASVQSNEQTMPCCQYMENRHFPEGLPIEEVRQGEHMKAVRNMMLEGKRPDGCSQCFEEEDAGIQSMRQSALNQYGHLDYGPIQLLEIVFDNVCNLKCRMCSSAYSHRLFADEKLLYGETLSPKKYIKNKIYKDIDLSSVKEITIYGGEPFYSKEAENFFNMLLSTANVEDLSFRINTNATVFPMAGAKEVLKKCKSAMINLSIDAYGHLNSVIRSGSNWDKIVEVMEFYDTMIDENPNITINVHSVIQVYNVNVINELNDFVKQQFPRFQSDIQVLQYPEFLSIKHLPKEYKESIRDTITDDNILGYLDNEAADLFEHFYNYDKSLNELRRESLKNSNPVLSNYISNYKSTSDSKDYLIQHIRFIKQL